MPSAVVLESLRDRQSIACVVQPWGDPNAAVRELTRSNSTELSRNVGDLLADAVGTIVLDVRSTVVISLFGFATIVRISKLVRDHGGRFVVVGLSDDLMDVVRQTKLDHVVEFVPESAWLAEGGLL